MSIHILCFSLECRNPKALHLLKKEDVSLGKSSEHGRGEGLGKRLDQTKLPFSIRFGHHMVRLPSQSYVRDIRPLDDSSNGSIFASRQPGREWVVGSPTIFWIVPKICLVRDCGKMIHVRPVSACMSPSLCPANERCVDTALLLCEDSRGSPEQPVRKKKRGVQAGTCGTRPVDL